LYAQSNLQKLYCRLPTRRSFFVRDKTEAKMVYKKRRFFYLL